MMADVPQLWEAYASRQRSLSNRTSVDDLAWGLEAALDRALDAISMHESEIDLDKVSETSRRRSRHRRALLIQYPQPASASTDVLGDLEARSDIAAVERHLGAAQIRLLLAWSAGATSAELGAAQGLSSDVVRARVSRARIAAKAALVHSD
jgi:hypothetical protein